MKKKVIMLSCIAAVAIASFVGTKAFQSNAYENGLLVQNVEALSQGDYTGNNSSSNNGGGGATAKGYRVVHYPCIKHKFISDLGMITEPDGTYYAECCPDPKSNAPFHNHGCMGCNSTR